MPFFNLQSPNKYHSEYSVFNVDIDNKKCFLSSTWGY